MTEIETTPDALAASLLSISKNEPVCILDSCGVRHLGSHLLIAGLRPVEVLEVSSADAVETAKLLDERLGGNLAAIFTLSYDFGVKLQGLSRNDEQHDEDEPDLFLSTFDALVIHDYDSGKTRIAGSRARCDEIAELIASKIDESVDIEPPDPVRSTTFTSDFTRSEYIAAVERIQESIRSGDTYQANLTQQIRCSLPDTRTPQDVFWRLRRDHPAPFAAFLTRKTSTVVSASPERFFRVTGERRIEASPIKGTRRRGTTAVEDERLRAELLSSEKDRAENTMIVDLTRNDLGRVCQYGSVTVEKLCEMEEHPSLFHLVSTVGGMLREEVKFTDILYALFPCGSITGAPKIRTMSIIGDIEPVSRGLSMGAIGCHIPEPLGGATYATLDLSVAIRTIVIRNGDAVFNVGGGVVIDSDPGKEYDESLLKAAALLKAIGTNPAN